MATITFLADSTVGTGAPRPDERGSGVWSAPGLRVRWRWDPDLEPAPAAFAIGQTTGFVLGAEAERVGVASLASALAAGKASTVREPPWGRWLVAAWSPERRALRIASDPMGRIPLYWARTASGVVASTDIAAVLAHPDVGSEIDEAAVALRLAHHFGPVERTLYRDVHYLAPGHVVETRPATGAATSRWWHWPDGVDTVPSFERWVEELRGITVAAVAEETPERDVGVTLSGGLDSSMLMGMVSALRDEPFTTLTLRYPGLPCDESAFQDAMLRDFGNGELSFGMQEFDPNEHLVAETHRRRLPVFRPDPEPTALFRSARAAGITHVVRGIGGDEIFAPYPSTWLDLLMGGRLTALGRAAGDSSWSSGRDQLGAVLRQVAKHTAPVRLLRRRAERHGFGWVHPRFAASVELAELVIEPRFGLSGNTIMAQRRYFNLESTFTQGSAEIDARHELSYGVRFVDPLRSWRLVERALAVPNDLLAGQGDRRRLQRAVAAPYLAPEVFDRRTKPHFDHSYATHLCDPWVADLLRSLVLEEHGLVIGEEVREAHRVITAAMRDGTELQSGTVRLWTLVGVEVWLREVVGWS